MECKEEERVVRIPSSIEVVSIDVEEDCGKICSRASDTSCTGGCCSACDVGMGVGKTKRTKGQSVVEDKEEDGFEKGNSFSINQIC